MRHLIFFADGEAGEFALDWVWIQQWCQLYGIYPARIDRKGIWPLIDRPPYNFRSLEDALACADFHGCTFVWLSERAEHSWDEPGVEIPTDDVVFCLGSDIDGFGGLEGEGVYLRMPPPNEECGWDPFHAAIVVPFLCFRTFGLQLEGARLP